MENIYEKKIKNYPDPISIQGTKKILEQMEKCICKIYPSRGTGFFCLIPYNNNKNELKVLITNYHLLDDNYIKNNKTIKITINDDTIDRSIKLDEKRIIYFNKKYDITIIEIKDNDNINNYLELDVNILKDDSEKLYPKNESIYILHYPNFDKASVSYGVITEIKDNVIKHKCCTEGGSSGSPILNLKNKKVIGIHSKYSSKFEFNIGSYLKFSINQMNKKNEIMIKLKIEETDVDKDIYFLDNCNNFEIDNVIHFHDNLKELNKDNVKLFIKEDSEKEEKEYEYQKYFQPKKQGIYNIRLELKETLIKDCSFMFAFCEKIIYIDLSFLDSSQIIDIKFMFIGCSNLETINISNFYSWNIINMKYIFFKCKNLKYIDLSSFEIPNVANMEGMFFECRNLETINISSMDIQNVTNIDAIFFKCNNLKTIKIEDNYSKILIKERLFTRNTNIIS